MQEIAIIVGSVLGGISIKVIHDWVRPGKNNGISRMARHIDIIKDGMIENKKDHEAMLQQNEIYLKQIVSILEKNQNWLMQIYSKK